MGTVTESYHDFAHVFWMPPENEGLSEATWAESEYGKAVEFIEKCGEDRDVVQVGAAAHRARSPTDDGLPVVDLEGDALARAALRGARAPTSRTRAAPTASARRGAAPSATRCRGPRSRPGTRLTDHALDMCGLVATPRR